MKKIFFILSVLLLTQLFSCKKGGFATLEGTVLEEGENDPIPNVYVRINKKSNFGDASPFLSATTDSKGHYSIKYYKNHALSSYNLDVISGEHRSVFGQDIDLRKSNIVTHLKPFAHFKVRIKNNFGITATVWGTISAESGIYFSGEIPANKDSILPHTFTVILNEPSGLSWNYSLQANSTIYGTFNGNFTVSSKPDTLIYLIQLN